jgi:hypothetical protein
MVTTKQVRSRERPISDDSGLVAAEAAAMKLTAPGTNAERPDDEV